MNEKETLERARVDMAAAFRLAARFQLEEGIDNHFSFQISPDGAKPGDQRFLFNTYGKHWAKMRASDIIVVDGEGTTVVGNAKVETSAFCIHVPLHQRCPAAKAVFHSHMPYATALSMVEGGRLEPAEQNALRFHDDVAYDEDYSGLAHDPAEGHRLAGVLGRKRILFMANHGVTVVGESVAMAFNDLYFLERACRAQYLAQTWGKLHMVNPQVAHKTKRQFDEEAKPYLTLFFDAMKKVLDEEEPNYRH